MVSSEGESFPKLLKTFRRHEGLTQEAIANRLHFSVETISAWERGKRKPGHSQIPRLARLLRMDTQELTQSLYPGNNEDMVLESSGFQETHWQQSSLMQIFASQEECEPLIRREAQHAVHVRILTIRGGQYFLGEKSLLYNSLLRKRGAREITIQMLVLSPDSEHITEELAATLRHDSAERIRRNMRSVLNFLKDLMSDYQDFDVKCYQGTPIFKLLIFDNVMFVSSYAGGGPKNDQNAKMFRFAREGNPLFMGLESHFDQLWQSSSAPF